jgi:hypothetical protein
VDQDLQESVVLKHGGQVQILRRKGHRWAAENKIVLLKDVTPGLQETWRGEWGSGDRLPPDATHKEGKLRRKDDRIGPTAQNQFQGNLVRLCRWAHGRGHFPVNPAGLLGSIRINESRRPSLIDGYRLRDGGFRSARAIVIHFPTVVGLLAMRSETAVQKFQHASSRSS